MAYGCFNRKPYAKEQRLYGRESLTGNYILTVIPERGNPDCQYQKDDKYNDKGCVGCSHKKPKGKQDEN